MIIALGGKTRDHARHILTRAAHALGHERMYEAAIPRRYRLTARAHKIERERMVAKVEGTRALATALEIALAAMRRDALHRFGLREGEIGMGIRELREHIARLADGAGQLGFDERHLEMAFRAPVAAAYRAGLASAKDELRSWPVHEAEKKRKIFTVNTAFEDFDPAAAIDALYQTTLEFSRQVVDRERDGLKKLLLDAIQHGDTADEINDSIRLFFGDGIHYVSDDGSIVRTIPEDAWIEMVSRTEIARAQNGGITDTYRAAGVEMVQFITAEDERVCPECEDLDGEIIPVDSDDIPPIHPSCRCTVIAHDEFSEQAA